MCFDWLSSVGVKWGSDGEGAEGLAFDWVSFVGVKWSSDSQISTSPTREGLAFLRMVLCAGCGKTMLRS